ncbi:MAG: hypothetical protein Q4E65_04090 [Clostridia bacterium]|nr:hypothetical protein [Clostridia bacterium]
MKPILYKLYARRGETLVETLVAILLLTLSAAMLAVMVSTAIRIHRETALASALLYREISIAEEGSKTGSVPVTVQIEDESVRIDADYTGAAGELYSYARPAKEAE